MESISISCFHGKPSPVELECVGSSVDAHHCDDQNIACPGSCWSIEDCLQTFMKSSDSQEIPPLKYVRRPDMTWLRCRQPTIGTKETVLGLLDCDDRQPRDIPIDFYAWIASPASGINKRDVYACVPYTSSRNRTALQHVCTPPPLNPKQQSVEIVASVTNRVKPVVHWVDFRTVSNFALSSASEIAHFLKSLLGSSQHVSPWLSSDELNETDRNHRTPLSQSECVIVVFSSPVSEKLPGFRVSDICPSWSLYSILSTELPKLISTGSNQLRGFPWNEMGQSGESRTDLESCELYIYRQLSQREYLSSRHPETNEEAPKGCLWESLVSHPLGEDDKKPDVTPHYEFRLVAPPYINPLLEFPYLKTLVEPITLRIIQEEAQMIPQWTAWPEQQHYKVSDTGAGAPWHVFPLCHCFPADDSSNLKWITQTSAYVPKTVALLKKVVGSQLRTALFSRLDPESVIEAHTGWSDLSNYVYRVHLPLQVPPGCLCGTSVDGCVEIHETGRLQAFDDSKIHRAFNYSVYDRVVLILDIARPADLPLGTAEGGHSDELDKFIEQMGGSG